ncbi:MAG: gfo/Idh/MocA family oxidoreductase, partial [Rhodothermales bacterium]|nr:gfo/Idh/MocA family oxidoreductase [Rhodothermales bacterium]
DFARSTMEYEDPDGNTVIAETTTSWSFVGAGLRLSAELLGPEYSLSYSSLESGVRVFLSREITGSEGEDLVEKQNAEQGLMPIVGNEAAAYGYENENRYFSQCFADGVQPDYNFEDGVAVMELLMAAYMSAEQERTIHWPVDGLDAFVPAVARGAWNP